MQGRFVLRFPFVVSHQAVGASAHFAVVDQRLVFVFGLIEAPFRGKVGIGVGGSLSQELVVVIAQL